MALFAVIANDNYPVLATKIASEFPDSFLKITDTQWLIAATGTAKEVSDKLGLAAGGPGLAIVFGVGSYFGFHNKNVWDWIGSRSKGTALV